MFNVIVICSLLTAPIQCDVSEILKNGWGNANSWSSNHNQFNSGRSNWQPITTSTPVSSAPPQNYIPYGVPARPPNYYLPQPQYNFTTPRPTQPPTTLPPPITTTTPVPSTTTTSTLLWPQQTGSWPQQTGSWHQQTGSLPQQPGSWPQQPGSWPQQPGSWPQQPGSWPQQPGSWPQQPGSWPQQPGSWPQQPGSWSQQPGSWPLQTGSWSQQPRQGRDLPQAQNLPHSLGNLPQQPGSSLHYPGFWSQPGSWNQQSGSWSQQPGSLSQQPGSLSQQPESLSQQLGSLSQQSGYWPQQPASWSQQPGHENQALNQPTYQPISSWLQVNPLGGNQDNKTSQTGNSFVESSVPSPPVPSPVIDLSFLSQPLALSSSIGNVTPMTQAMFLNQINKNKEITSDVNTVSSTMTQPLPEPLPVMMPPSMTSNANAWMSQQNIHSPSQGSISGQHNAVPLAMLWPPQSAWTLQQTKTASSGSQPQQPSTITWPQQSSWITEPKSSPFRNVQEMVPQISTSVSMTVPSTSGNSPQVMQMPVQMVPEIQVMTFKATPVQQQLSNQYLPQVFNRPQFVPQSPQNISYHWATNNNGGNNGWNSAPGGNKAWITPSAGGNNAWSSITPGFSGQTPNTDSNVRVTYWPSRKRK